LLFLLKEQAMTEPKKPEAGAQFDLATDIEEKKLEEVSGGMNKSELATRLENFPRTP
jgi:hypothetical protein